MVMALAAVAMMAQQPVITFEKTDHDFGKINEADGKVTTIFTFKNEGMEPLVLSNVRASCGCTTPKWPRQPIEPGQTGEITVTYNPNGRPGRFTKTVTITSNATEPTKRVTIKGEVIPKPAKPVDNYPVKMGELSLKQSKCLSAINVPLQLLAVEVSHMIHHVVIGVSHSLSCCEHAHYHGAVARCCGLVHHLYFVVFCSCCKNKCRLCTISSMFLRF